MPCRCDEYEVADRNRALDSATEKVKHLEEQLCNARSLIHKLLKHIDSHPGAPVAPRSLPADLRERANAHIKLLADHKRAEHEQDLENARREIQRLDLILDQQLRAVEGQKAGAEKTRKALEDARARLGLASVLKDEELLG